MSLSLEYPPERLTVGVIAILFPAIRLDVSANPPDIVSISGKEFKINMNNMEMLQPYLMKFDGSHYVIWKNVDGALVMEEVSIE